MIDGSHETDDLRRAFQEHQVGDAPHGGCPPAERLKTAAHDRCRADEFNRILDHTVTCAACATAWRIARQLRDEETASAAPVRRSPVPAWALAAAAVLVIGIGVIWVPQLVGPSRSPVYRSNDVPAIQNEIEDGSVLHRNRALLRWSCNLEDAVYSIRVSDLDLKTLASADHLEETEFLVPREALIDLASGDVVLWRIEAFNPDGSRAASPVYSIRLE